MDLLYHRYASPFSLIDNVIENGVFENFISDFFAFADKSECWEFFLHKVHDKSYNEFIESLKPPEKMTVGEIETVIKNSQNMLNCEFEEVRI